jgi:hypothetical protein
MVAIWFRAKDAGRIETGRLWRKFNLCPGIAAAGVFTRTPEPRKNVAK